MRTLLITLVLLSGCASQPQSDEQKPNFIILFADDLGYGDLGSYGHPYIRTPNLDQLAAEGQRWTDFYVADPVCSPSRGALLTGRLPVRSGLYGEHIAVLFPNDPAGMPAAETTMAEVLSDNGYATAIVGKWHLGDQPDVYPTRHGFDYWYGIPYSNDMDWVGEPTFDEVLKIRAEGRVEELRDGMARRMLKYFDPKTEYWNVPVMRSRKTSDGYIDELVERPAQQTQNTQQYTREALSFIEDNSDGPFMLYVPYSMPHTPIFRSAAFEGKSEGGLYADVVEELDWSVGAIVEKLKALDIDENTLVVFTSDNGPWLFMQHHGGSAGLLRNGKGTTFEGGMRVPAVFWWPGKLEQKVVSDIGSTLDLYNTILSLAGVEAGGGQDGFDLSGVLLNGAESPRDAVAYYRQGELRAYRKGDFKLHVVTEGAYGMPPQREEHESGVLHDLKNDPSERFDVADRFPDKRDELLMEIKAHQASVPRAAPVFDQRLRRK